VHRLAEIAGVAILVTVVTALLVHVIPGGPARAILGPKATSSEVATLTRQMGLDHPLPQEIATYIWHALRGNLGHSLAQPESVTHIIGQTLPITLSIIASVIVLSTVLGTSLGLWAATSSMRLVRTGISGILIGMLAMPPFFVALVLILLLSVSLGVLPAGGWGNAWPENFRYLVLPTLALSAYLMPILARAVRQSAEVTMGEDFVEAALSRGFSRRWVIIRHVLPNSSLPVIALIGYNAGALIGGVVVVEAVLGIPGMGLQLVTSVEARDYPVIQGIVLCTAVLVIIANLVTDAVNTLIDPRLRRTNLRA